MTDPKTADEEAVDHINASITAARQRLLMTDAEYLAERDANYCWNQRNNAQMDIDNGKAWLKQRQYEIDFPDDFGTEDG